MRTAYVLLRFPVPTETFVFQEVADLRRLGLAVEVFTLYGERTAGLSADMRATDVPVERLGWRAAPAMVRALGHWWRRKPGVVTELLRAMLRQRWRGLEKSGENILALLASFELARRLEAAGIEHVHAPWASGCATAAWAAWKLTGKPFSFTARAWDIYPPDRLLREKILGAALVRAETEANVQHLVGVAGEQPGKFHVTYNGVPLQASRPASVDMRPPFRLLAMGRFVPKKGFDQLLLAVRLLADAGIDVRLTLVGDGILRLPLELRAARLGIARRIRFPGFVPHDAVGELFAGSDVFVMPSVVAPSGDRDGIPTVILEALTFGVPVVATAVSGIPEVIEDGVTGLLVRERDPRGIADAVRRLVSNREGALAMAARGRERVARQYDAARNHRRVLELYDRLVGDPGGRAEA